MLKQVHVYVKGDVIGVGFRAWTKIQAKLIGVNGWVRNVYDKPDTFCQEGGVEVVIQGEGEKVNKMLELLKKGPLVSRVDDLKISFENPKEVLEGFEIRS